MPRASSSFAVARPTGLSYKLGIPRVGDHVRREALLARLTAARQRAAITWVVGLPGSGKTSVVARWVEEFASGPYGAVGYRLDADDADGAAWLAALGSALAGEYPALPHWSPENQVDIVEFAPSFFAALARRPLTLVLDDCHRVGDDAPLFAMLATLHEVAGDTLRAVVLSRREPPPVLMGGTVGGWLEVVDDLRLTGPEVLEVARRVAGDGLREEGLHEDDVASLGTADGWLAHVLALARRRTGGLRAAGDPAGRVGDFLASELLASVPKAQRARLRRLAELPEIPEAPEGDTTAPWVTPEVGRLLGTLAAQRYFVDGSSGRYRLHDLLRDALLRLNAAEDDAGTLAEARRGLATWCGPTMPEAAMQLRALAGDTTGALALIAVHGPSWLSRGLHRQLLAWLNALPAPAETRDQAALALFRAQALLPLEPETSRPLFAESRRLFTLSGDRDRAYAAWCGEVESFVIQWGAVHGLAPLVDDLEALSSTLGPPEGDLLFRTSAAALTALMYGRAEDPRIERFASATARAIVHAPDAGARISAAAQLLIYKLWWSGDFPGGRALYDTFDEEVSRGDTLDALPRLMWWSCASIVDWQCGDPKECYRKVDRGLALAASSGVHVRDFFLLTQGIFCALNEEDWPRAEAHLVELARTERTHKRLDAMVHHFFRSWFALSRNDPHKALAHAELAWPLAEALGSTFHKVIVLSALAPARVHAGDLEGAEQAYRTQLALAKAAQNPTFSFIAFCAGAEIALARGDEARAKKQIERMLQVKYLGGFHSHCGWRTPMMRSILAFAIAHDILPDIARQWIREKKIAPPDAPPAGWPLPVRIEGRTGLQVRVEAGSEEKAAGGKTAHRLRALVAVLAATRTGASQGELGDWLWPDADGDRAATSLKVAIHRARQWLGAGAIRVSDGVVSLNPAQVGCDLWGLRPGTLAAGEAEAVLRGFEAPPVLALRAVLRRA